MVAAFSSNLVSAEPLMRGLKFGGLMNEALEDDDTFRRGRHHVMTALNQSLSLSLAFEQLERCYQAAGVNFPLAAWNFAIYAVPMGVSFFASREIKFLQLSRVANFVQSHLGKLSLVAMAASTAALFVLGQITLAATTLTYLSVGVLCRYNILPQKVQNAVHHAGFFIGNFAGLYLGGNFVRVICMMNLMIKVVERFFESKRLAEAKKTKAATKMNSDEKNIEKEPKTQITLKELEKLTNDTICPIRTSHLYKNPLQPVGKNVKIEHLLEECDKIDWPKHEIILKKKLAKDKRWVELEQYNSKPFEYFKKSLKELVESIKDQNILEGKPESYEMLEYYCRYIAEHFKEHDEMTRVDMLLKLAIEGGGYCGAGKFRMVEEVYESLTYQAVGIPLETRVLACAKLERHRIWENIYQLLWKTSPVIQFFGYMSDVNAVHNANLFSNLVQAGRKFGIPHESAKNDKTAVINPFTHYVAFSSVKKVEDCFWKEKSIPQCYFEIKKPSKQDRWKVWKWINFKFENVTTTPYNQKAILDRFAETIGTPQLKSEEIHMWWYNWVNRQQGLSDDKKEELGDELIYGLSSKNAEGKEIFPFNGEAFAIDKKIQPKFLIAMLIEMGFLEKPVL